jgi:integrase/recombinase XerD
MGNQRLRTAEFLKERKYPLNVSERTIQWDEQSIKWLEKYCPDDITQAGLTIFVVGMREKGLSASSCNNRIRAVKAYMVWAELPFKLNYLKEEQKVVEVLTPEQIAALVKFVPRSASDRRLQTLVLTPLDTGSRIDEALTLRIEHVDFENLQLVVTDKGAKQRRIPISRELRKRLGLHRKNGSFDLLFSSRGGTHLSKRNVLHAFNRLRAKLGFPAPRRAIHSFRHTFAIHYLRNGGNLYYLSRILGHTSTRATERYLRAVQTHDLSAVHRRLSILARNG